MSLAENTKVIDKDDAVWIVNVGQFRWPHGEREGIFFDVGTAYKIKMDAWIEGQKPILQQIEDPHTSELPSSPIIEPSPKLGPDGKPVTGVGTGPEGSGNADDVRKQQEAAAAKAKAEEEAAAAAKAAKDSKTTK